MISKEQAEINRNWHITEENALKRDKILEKMNDKRLTGIRDGWTNIIVDVANLLPKNSRVLDIGACMGSSSIAAVLATKDKEGIVYSLEPGFLKPEHWPDDYAPFKQDILSSLKNVIYQGYLHKCPGSIVPIPGVSKEILPIWDGRLFDLIVIDGWHSYEGIYWDVQWAKFTKPNAYMLFDDWIEPVEKAAMEYYKEHPEWKRVNLTLFKKGEGVKCLREY